MPAEGNVGLAFGLVIAAGLSTTIGSTFAFCSNFANRRLLAGALGISAGVMIYVSFVEIFSAKGIQAFVEAGYSDDAATRSATACFFGGIAITWILDKLVHRLTGHDHSSKSGSFSDIAAETDTPPHHRSIYGGCHQDGQPGMCCDPVHVEGGQLRVGDVQAPAIPATVGDFESGITGGDGGVKVADGPGQDEERAKALEKMSLMTGLAIAIHNFPEGLATFVAALADSKLGASIALAIALHNIPEGICVAMPVYYATGSRWKGFWWSFLSGISEPIGGLCGYFILYGDNMSELAYGILFAIVAGMMIYISMKELIPTAHKYDPVDSYVTNCVFVGMAVMAASLLMFTV